jgi:hypothetical protein
MTLTRKAAIKIINAVVRFAPAASREWATAAQGELWSIESDWKALFWALGSARMLFGPHSVSLAGLYDVPAAAKKLSLTTYSRLIVLSLALVIAGPSFVAQLIHASSGISRLGNALFVAGMFYMEYQAIARLARKVPCGSDLMTRARLYHYELERQRDFHRGSCFWSRWAIGTVGLCCLIAGMIREYPSGDHADLFYSYIFVLVLMGLGAPWLNLSQARDYERKIEALDAIQSEQ